MKVIMKKPILCLACLAATAACADEFDYTPLSFAIVDDRIIAIGEIDSTSLDTFEDLIKNHPDKRTLVLKNIGGSVDDEANVEFSRVIRDMGFTTVVPSDGLVASGGTDLFLAGTRRIIEAGACIGVHSWAAGNFTATDLSRTSAEHDRYLDYYDDIDIDPDFYWFTIEAAPADGMHWMTPEEVDQYGVSTVSVESLSTAAICNSR
jgi:hypothetical protein